MLQLTAARVVDPGLFAEPIVVAAAAHAEAVRAQLGTEVRLILEPCGRNTAPAIALAALAAEPEALLLVMPSDHLVAEPSRMTAAVRAGIPLAEQGWLVTFGVRPTRPEIGFGYIKRAEGIGADVFRVDRFVEKPDAATAAAFLADGGYDWNAGIFLFTAGAFLRALVQHAPDILDAVAAALPEDRKQARQLAPSREAFERARSISVDRAVMERDSRVAVAPVDAGWSDLGSWDALHAASPKDEDGNVLCGQVEALATSGCLVRSEGPRVVAIGVRDLTIVATPDAVLVVPLAQSQAVSEAVARLQQRGDDVT